VLRYTYIFVVGKGEVVLLNLDVTCMRLAIGV